MTQIDTWTWSHTCWDHLVLIGPQVWKWDICRLSYKLTSHDLHLWPLTSWACEGFFIISLNQVSFQQDFNFQMRRIFHFEPTLQLDVWWKLNLAYELWLHVHTKGPILYQYFQPVFHLNLKRPLTLKCDLWPHQQMKVPMLHLWPNSVEIHQSMWKLESNVNLFSQQQQQQIAATTTTAVDKVIYVSGLQNPQDHGTAVPRKKLTPQKMFKTKKLKK